MKVTIVTNYWKESPGGGVKTYLVNLVDELQKRENIEVHVVFREGEDEENYKILGNKFLFSIKAFLSLRYIKPQVIHSQGSWYCLLPGYAYKKIYGAILVHTFHTKPDKKLSVLGKLFVQFLFNGCDRVTFVSKGLENNVRGIHRLKFKKTVITYAGVKSKEVSEKEIREFSEKFRIEGGSPVLLAQSLTAHKHKAEGVKLLIKAVRKLKDKYPNIILILTREGLFSNELREFAKSEGLDDKLVFTGDVDNPHVPLVICDIFTHTPLFESGVGLALLEAMSMGKPIVATSVGGIPEAIDEMENGILVEPNVDEITQKIEQLLQDKDLAKKLGENAKETVKRRFTWEKAADKFMEIYQGGG